jgi:large subunit ribosomal protein L13
MQKLTKYKQEIEPKWFIIDATDVRLGKISAKVAELFLGKDQVTSVDYEVTPVSVVITNSDKLSYHPRKAKNKIYSRHSGFMGGLKQISLEDQMRKDSRVVIREAISGMLPKQKLRDIYLSQLHIFKDGNHKHAAQKPNLITI